MNPKGLATTRRKKKGGRAAVIPLGEVNPPPPEGSERVRICFRKVFRILVRILRTQRVQPGPAHSAKSPTKSDLGPGRSS